MNIHKKHILRNEILEIPRIFSCLLWVFVLLLSITSQSQLLITDSLQFNLKEGTVLVIQNDSEKITVTRAPQIASLILNKGATLIAKESFDKLEIKKSPIKTTFNDLLAINKPQQNKIQPQTDYKRTVRVKQIEESQFILRAFPNSKSIIAGNFSQQLTVPVNNPSLIVENVPKPADVNLLFDESLVVIFKVNFSATKHFNALWARPPPLF